MERIRVYDFYVFTYRVCVCMYACARMYACAYLQNARGQSDIIK